VLALRLLGVAAALLMALYIFRLTRLYGSSFEASAAAIVASANPFTIGLAIQVKHYILEGAAAAAVLYSAACVSRHPGQVRALIVFFVSGFIGYMFSFTLLFVVVSCSIVVTFVVFKRDLETLREPEQPSSGYFYLGWRIFYDSRRAVLVCAFLAAVGFAFYFAYSKQIVSANLSAFPDVYETAQRPLAQLPLEFLDRIVHALSPFDQQIWGGAHMRSTLLVGSAFLIGLSWLFALKRSAFAAISALTCLILLMTAHAAGAFPFSYHRHLFFIVPIVSPVIVLGLGGLFHWVTRARFLEDSHWSFAALAVFCIYSASAIVAANRRDWGFSPNSEISPQLAHVRDTSPEAPILAHPDAQPALQLLGSAYHLRSLIAPQKILDPDPRKSSQKFVIWTNDELQGLPEVWLLFAGEPESERAEIIGVAQRIVSGCGLERQSGSVTLYHCLRP
jgi:hypothetical protein